MPPKEKRKDYDKDTVQRYLKANPLFEDALVNTVRSYPAIWDPENGEYQKVRVHREMLFEQVAKDLCTEGYQVSVEFAKNHWEHLRACYTRKRRPLPSGSAAAKEKVSKQWPIFMALDFLWDITGGTSKHADSLDYDGVNNPPNEPGNGEEDDGDPRDQSMFEDGEPDFSPGGHRGQTAAQNMNTDNRAGTSGNNVPSERKRSGSSQSTRSSSAKCTKIGAPSALPAVLAALNGLNDAPRSDSAQVMGIFIATELGSIQKQETKEWLMRTMHDLVYVVKTAERRRGYVLKDVKRAVQSGISGANVFIPDDDVDDDDH